jgi:hypothetical protein
MCVYYPFPLLFPSQADYYLEGHVGAYLEIGRGQLHIRYTCTTYVILSRSFWLTDEKDELKNINDILTRFKSVNTIYKME